MATISRSGLRLDSSTSGFRSNATGAAEVTGVAVFPGPVAAGRSTQPAIEAITRQQAWMRVMSPPWRSSKPGVHEAGRVGPAQQHEDGDLHGQPDDDGSRPGPGPLLRRAAHGVRISPMTKCSMTVTTPNT